MAKKFWKTTSLWVPPLLWMGVLFFLSSIPGLSIAEGVGDFLTRKAAHLFSYALLFYLFFRALKPRRIYFWQKVFLALSLSVGYGIFDEFHQSLVPLREGKAIDVIIDGVGALLGFAYLWLLPIARIRLKK